MKKVLQKQARGILKNRPNSILIDLNGVNRGFIRWRIITFIVITSIILLFSFIWFFKLAQKPEQQVSTPNSLNEMQKIIPLVNLTSMELAVMLAKKDFFFANVHIPYAGEIKNTDIFFPYDEVVGNVDKLPKDKDAKIVLYCQSGRMSEIAGNELLRLGYTNISHLSGGMIDWKKSGYEIIKK